MLNSEILRRHADLVDRMASALGLDLEEKILSGDLQTGAVGDAVLACTACSNLEGCSHWLSMQNGTASAAPGMCRNSDLFASLKNDGRY